MVKRSIFGDSRYPEYTEIEKKKITEFIGLLKKHDKLKHILNVNEQTLLLKMIYANKYNLEKALHNYKDLKEWQGKFVPI